MYTLYIGNKSYSSWSLRPWLLMRALSIPFEERLVAFAEGPNRDRFRRFSLNGKVPCLHDGGTVVWDSLTIAEYLAERHEGVWPKDAPARAWARCAAAEMHSGFEAPRSRCPMSCGVRVTMASIDGALAEDLDSIGELWDEGLERFGGPYLAGPGFTAADAFCGPVAFRAQTYGLPLAPAARDYCTRLLDHPAMREWHAAALEEPWREAGHEAELAAAGTVTADHRRSPAAG